MFHKALGAFMAGLGIVMIIKLPFMRNTLIMAVAMTSSAVLVFLGARLITL